MRPNILVTLAHLSALTPKPIQINSLDLCWSKLHLEGSGLTWYVVRHFYDDRDLERKPKAAEIVAAALLMDSVAGHIWMTPHSVPALPYRFRVLVPSDCWACTLPVLQGYNIVARCLDLVWSASKSEDSSLVCRSLAGVCAYKAYM